MRYYLIVLFVQFLISLPVHANEKGNLGCTEITATQCVDIAIDFMVEARLLKVDITQANSYLDAAQIVTKEACSQETNLRCLELVVKVQYGYAYARSFEAGASWSSAEEHISIFEERCSVGDYLSCRGLIVLTWSDERLSREEQDNKISKLEARILELTSGISDEVRKKCWTGEGKVCLERGMLLELGLIKDKPRSKNSSFTSGCQYGVADSCARIRSIWDPERRGREAKDADIFRNFVLRNSCKKGVLEACRQFAFSMKIMGPIVQVELYRQACTFGDSVSCFESGRLAASLSPNSLMPSPLAYAKEQFLNSCRLGNAPYACLAAQALD